MTPTIRPFQPKDLDCLIQLATLSFAEDFTARGLTPTGFARQARLITRGRMLPFKLFTAIAGYKWEIFVAEVDNQVVGCGGYLGRDRMELVNLMVHPEYRRRGIGQALLEYRLQRLTDLGYPLVTTTILANNVASLGNATKQGFVVFDRYTLLESPLPLPHFTKTAPSTARSRPIHSTDRGAFLALESQNITPRLQEIEGSVADRYFLSIGDRGMNRLNQVQTWTRTFMVGEEVVGFLAARVSSGRTKGSISRPIITDAAMPHLPEMVKEAATWLAQQGKTKVQIAVPHTRSEMLALFETQGWHPTLTWVRLVKWLNR